MNLHGRMSESGPWSQINPSSFELRVYDLEVRQPIAEINFGGASYLMLASRHVLVRLRISRCG
jgi:hypothetical protein